MSPLRRGSFWLDSVLISTVTILVTARYLSAYWHSTYVGGFDASAHYGAARYYAENIFPETYAWTQRWFAGMPFPIFYPPLFYMAVAAALRTFSLDPVVAFKLVSIGIFYSFPIAVLWLTRKMQLGRSAGILSGLLTALLITIEHKGAEFGVGLQGQFECGLSTHSLGSLFLIGWAGLELDPKSSASYKNWVCAGALLGLTTLSNVHTTEVLGMMIGGIAVYRGLRGEKPRAIALRYGTQLGVGLLLSAFWLFPMITHFWLVNTMPLSFDALGQVLHAWVPFFLVSAMGIPALLKGRIKSEPLLMLLVGCGVLLLFVALPIHRIWGGFPFQPARLLVTLYLFFPILMAMGILGAHESLRNRSLAWRLLPWGWSLFVCAFIWHPATYRIGGSSDATISGLAAFMQDRKDGRFVIEYPRSHEEGVKEGKVFAMYRGPDSPNPDIDMLVANSAISAPQGGPPAIWTVFREASISATFATPLRNLFSTRNESFGIDTWLSLNPAFLDQPPEARIQWADRFAVRYYITRSLEKLIDLTRYGFKHLARFGRWNVFENPQSLGFAQVLSRYPILVFSKFTAKKRVDGDTDFLSLLEQLYLGSSTPPYLTLAPESRLDRAPELAEGSLFAEILIAQWKYADAEAAFQRVMAASRTKRIYLMPCPVDERDGLCSRVMREVHPPGARGVSGLFAIANTALAPWPKQLLSLSAQREPAEADSAGPRIHDLKYDDHEIRFTLEDAPGSSHAAIPVLLKFSWFPAWRDSAGQALRMVSPTFMLLEAAPGENRVVWTKPVSVWIAQVVSILAWLGLAAWLGLSVFRLPRSRLSERVVEHP